MSQESQKNGSEDGGAESAAILGKLRESACSCGRVDLETHQSSVISEKFRCNFVRVHAGASSSVLLQRTDN